MRTYTEVSLRMKARLPVAVALLAVVVIFATLTVGIQPAFAQAETGFCLDDRGGGSCSANDVRIGTLTVAEIVTPCFTAGSYATVKFRVQFITGPSRFDESFFIALDGSSAADGGTPAPGGQCYHDFLHPVTNVLGNVILDGGPYYDADGDVCADTNPSPVTMYYTTEPIQVLCADNLPAGPPSGDGLADPISTCTAWKTEGGQNTTCSNVTQATANPGSKCDCKTVQTDLLLYTGYDFGDAPASYQTALTNGARHLVQRDTNADGLPNDQGTIPAVWLGSLIDLETDGIPSAVADSDGGDEDGVTTIGTWTVNSASVLATVGTSSGTCANCRLAFWVDWDASGTFDASELEVRPVVSGPNTITFDPPVSAFPTYIYARFRLYDAAQSTYSPSGIARNGEVEDYRWFVTPLGVTLADFSAEQVADYIKVTWETNTELNNRGFNLHRGTSLAGPDRQLNDTLIPSQSQGNPGGFIYTWDDHADLVSGTSYFYWIDDVDTNNVATRHGPVSVDYSGPTAVTVSSVQANPVATPYALPLAGTLLALLVPLAGALAVRRRRA